MCSSAALNCVSILYVRGYVTIMAMFLEFLLILPIILLGAASLLNGINSSVIHEFKLPFQNRQGVS